MYNWEWAEFEVSKVLIEANEWQPCEDLVNRKIYNPSCSEAEISEERKAVKQFSKRSKKSTKSKDKCM